MGESEVESSIFQLSRFLCHLNNILLPKEINSVCQVSTDSVLFALHDALYLVFKLN